MPVVVQPDPENHRKQQMNRQMIHRNETIMMNGIVRLIVTATVVIVIEVIAIVTVTIDRVIEFI